MKKIVLVLFILSITVFSYYQVDAKVKVKRIKTAKANKCIDVYMTKKITDNNNIEFFVFAKNKCNEITVVNKQLKVTAAKNVTARKGEIIDLTGFIVPKKETKKVLMVEQESPNNKKTIFWWKLIKARK